MERVWQFFKWLLDFPNDLEKQINRLIEKYDIDEYVDFFIFGVQRSKRKPIACREELAIRRD